MKSIDARLRKLLGDAPKTYWEEKISSKPGYWGERILSQMVFAHEVSKVEGYRYNEPIEAALSYVEQQIAEEGVIGKHTSQHVESMLSELAAAAKSYDIICAAHAHIDMNWMWPWDETVAVTIDTFRTMLNLMNEYPDFRFSQSQASIYRIVEQYAPDMLQEIKKRVKEGRWEVTASHWVEADKNMPNGESLARHLLYTKRYLSQLFDIDPDSLNLDFEPDTFGHSVNVPEILANGGVKFYYHCRGNDGHIVYRWQAPSGKSVIVYREPTWYNDSVQPILGSYVPEICRQTGLKTYLNVYGVGDHGGGPTRRDLERIMDMNDWPIYPQIRFGTFSEYYKLVEPIADKLPVVTGEINFVFTGCYTSQTRIKTANRIGEATLNEAETFSSVAAVATGSAYPGAAYEEAWRNVLFNQFHDILPGSGVIETREHALGLFQNTMAIASTNRKLALESIAATIDTSQWSGPEDKLTVSEGAGVGYGTREFKITQVERGRGNTRIVHFFNPSVYNREETAEFVLWDWNSPIKTLIVRDSEGRDTAHQVIDEGFNPYWGHHYMRLLVYVKAPACGYSTYTISEGEGSVNPFLPTDPRVERENKYVLENDVLRVTFHPVDATVISMIHKNNKYGFRGADNALSVSLIRSSYDPDPYPELGNHHRISIGVCVVESACDHELIETAYRFNHPFNVLSGTPHTGTRTFDGSFLKLTEGKVVVAAVKMPEQDTDKRWIIRVYETEGQRTTATLQLFQAVSAAYYVDMNERKVSNDGSIQASGKTVTFEVPAYSVASICLEFE
ncbi:glycosyl hydrolase-related protein [Paenibacillus sp. WQ 127069]|uniref:Glycosyl hydrolase-related protein n=1 Tax=Paenibacillus baimaensis TaxID=2982185 RepID=A0ABT2ULK3_9BACL|nr:alpha-mannosidase [Paenibacillus sp. WQ 127069]MCU6795530.1 glycosyl hydrolase-related protein [Paenibacillus sp. WQ 127069]